MGCVPKLCFRCQSFRCLVNNLFEIKYSIRLYMESKDAGPEDDGYDPSMLCNFCLLNQHKDVKRCRMLSTSAGTPDAFVKAMHENDIEMMRGLVNHGFDKDSIYGSKVKNTMLCIAAMNGLDEAFDFLLDLDANATTLNSAGVDAYIMPAQEAMYAY